MQESNRQNNLFILELSRYQFIHKLKQLSFIQRIYLYGSRARGDYSRTSDIDLAIVCPNASPFDWDKVMNIIEEADTLLKIDCVRFDQVDDKLKNNILKQGVLIYEK